MATVGEDAKKIMLRSCDAKEFEVDEAVAKQLEMFAKMIKDGCPEGGIPLLNITNKALDVVLEYCKKHTDFATTEEEIAAWDADYINVGQDILYDVIMVT
ncbi:SKP1-like protein 1A [Cocos nucifera]|uniref:SKP1-like protein 1A n=1 Tax=Cocos nucifera TaxID=13894 RepID=A0A8K0N819_COCNU|nr:SKP1-like protein 1A [Cocos nucifera]